jgi:phosphoribosylaminoimidazole (AIR) synthetase
MDIVNHCINDILVQGARPYSSWIFCLVTIAARNCGGKSGWHGRCLPDSGLRLLGGETADMRGLLFGGM